MQEARRARSSYLRGPGRRVHERHEGAGHTGDLTSPTTARTHGPGRLDSRLRGIPFVSGWCSIPEGIDLIGRLSQDAVLYAYHGAVSSWRRSASKSL